jgi:hypothetical protein
VTAERLLAAARGDRIRRRAKVSVFAAILERRHQRFSITRSRLAPVTGHPALHKKPWNAVH